MLASNWQWLALASAVAAGVVSGILYGFSGFVMRGLGELDSVHSIRAMQAINVAALRPGLMVPFIGTTLLTVGLAIAAYTTMEGPALKWYLAGTALYVLGVFAVTAAGNVPLNEALDKLQPVEATAAADWTSYARPWLRFNHLRSVAGALASAAFILSALSA